MLRRLSLIATTAAALLLAAVPAAAAPLTIDFESFPGADGVLGTADDTTSGFFTPLSDQFAALGVVFNSGTLFQYSFFDGNLNNHFLSSTQPNVSFTVPVYGISIDSRSYWNATLSAFDALGNVIASSTLINPDQGGSPLAGTLSLTSTQRIHGFAVHADSSDWILNLDNLVLDVGVAEVPEPSPALLFPLALAGLMVARRRKG